MNKQELNFIRSIVSCLTALTALLVAFYYNNFYFALWTIVVLEVVAISSLSAYMMYLVKFSFLTSIIELSKYLLLCLIIGTSLSLIKLFFDLNIIALLSLISLATLLYYALLLYFDQEIYQILKRYLPSTSKRN